MEAGLANERRSGPQSAFLGLAVARPSGDGEDSDPERQSNVSFSVPWGCGGGADGSQKHANSVDEPEDEPDFDEMEAAPNAGGSGSLMPVPCARCIRRMASDPAKFRRHRCAFPPNSAGNRCHWCASNNKSCFAVSPQSSLLRWHLLKRL